MNALDKNWVPHWDPVRAKPEPLATIPTGNAPPSATNSTFSLLTTLGTGLTKL